MRASHIKTFPGHGSFTSSNLVGETHVPRNAPGTPQANAVFGRPGRIRGSADESEMRARRAEEHAHRGELGREAARARGEKQGWARGNVRLGSGDHEVPGQANAPLAPDGQAASSGTRPALLPRGTHPPGPPLGRRIPGPREPTMRSGRPRRRRRMPGPIRWNTAPSWSPHNPRTPACAY